MSELLPLQELFTRLREAGLPLGLRDYEAVVVALQGGYGVGDRAALERLCRTLWVRSLDEGRVFDYCFGEVMVGGPLAPKFGGTGELLDSKSPRIGGFGGRFGRLRPLLKKPWVVPIAISVLVLIATITVYNGLNSQKKPSSTKPETPEMIKKTVTGPITPLQQTPFFSPQVLTSAVAAIALFLLLWYIQRSRSANQRQRPTHNHLIQQHKRRQLFNESHDEIQLAKIVRNTTAGALTDYLPVTQRQMQQSWRYLRRFVREGTPTELDVEATVRQMAQSGMLLDPVLVPPRRSQTELL
jgi:uncharacterized protein